MEKTKQKYCAPAANPLGILFEDSILSLGIDDNGLQQTNPLDSGSYGFGGWDDIND